MYHKNRHAHIASMVIERANKRTKNRNGREAKAEKAKLKEMPRPDATRPQDLTPRNVVSPQSSWNSIHGDVTIGEFLPGESFSFSKKPR